jgi:hypothetical protein
VQVHQTSHIHEQTNLSPVLAPLPASQLSRSYPDRPAEDVFQLWHGRDALVPAFSKQKLPVPILNDTERRRATARDITEIEIDVRFMSAREMVNLSTKLYMKGLITWEVYDALAFQPELHPDYNKTVGAMLEKEAQPDRPRDFVREWEKRLSFVRRYNRNDIHTIETAQRITMLLHQLAGVLDYK